MGNGVLVCDGIASQVKKKDTVFPVGPAEWRQRWCWEGGVWAQRNARYLREGHLVRCEFCRPDGRNRTGPDGQHHGTRVVLLCRAGGASCICMLKRQDVPT